MLLETTSWSNLVSLCLLHRLSLKNIVYINVGLRPPSLLAPLSQPLSIRFETFPAPSARRTPTLAAYGFENRWPGCSCDLRAHSDQPAFPTRPEVGSMLRGRRFFNIREGWRGDTIV